MILRTASNCLGLLFSDRGIVCAQVTSSGVDRIVKQVALFTSDNPILGSPAETGRNLKIFLDSHGFTSTRAVVGVPAKWTIAQEKDVPPAGVEEVKSILRLAAERLSLSDTGAMAVDYAGELNIASGRTLLVGILKSQLEKISKLIEAAELSLVGACPAALATSAFVSGDHSMLYLASGSVELVQWQAGAPRSVRALNANVNDPSAIGQELKRTLALRGGIPSNMLICNGSDMGETQSNDLLSRIGSNAKTITPESGLGVSIDSAAMNGSANVLKRGTVLPAVALALGGIDRARLPVDFVKSKLGEEKKLKIGKQSVYAAGIGIGLLLMVAILYITAQTRQSELETLQKQNASDANAIKIAQNSITRLEYGRSYFNERPDYLGCLRDLSQMFDYEEKIWATSVTLKNDNQNHLQGVIQGRSADYTINLRLSERFDKNPLFQPAGLGQSHPVSSKSNEDSYSVSFIYMPGKKKP